MENIIERNKGLTGFQLKLIALILMVFDHSKMYLGSLNLPIWFGWLGRIVAPLFIFMTVEGYYHTSSKKKYMTRLYIGHVIMSILNDLITELIPRKSSIEVMHSMFGSLFLVILYLLLFDYIRNGLKSKNKVQVFLGILGMIAPFALNFAIIILMGNDIFPLWILRLLINLIPLPLFVEGNGLYILMAILLYIFRDNRLKQVISYILISLPLLFSTKFNLNTMFYENYQWIMLFAAPFMYLYNGKEGKKMKNLFYFFYPIHIYLLYIIGTVIE